MDYVQLVLLVVMVLNLLMPLFKLVAKRTENKMDDKIIDILGEALSLIDKDPAKAKQLVDSAKIVHKRVKLLRK